MKPNTPQSMLLIHRRSLFLLALIAIAVAIFFQSPYKKPALNNDNMPPTVLSLSGYTMGTSYQIQMSNPPQQANLERIREQIKALLHRMDKEVFSTYEIDSELSQLNRSPINQKIMVSTDLAKVITTANRIYHQTNHSFDITVSPLVNLWGFGSTELIDQNYSPSEIEIERAMQKLGGDQIQVNNEELEVIKTKEIEMDLSAIAKGYAVDQVADLLNANGINHFIVEIGGEIRVSGQKSGEIKARIEPINWTLAIESPDNEHTKAFESFSTNGQSFAVAGSGSYRNYFEREGQRYSHEINPRTGRPIYHDLVAVTVITNKAIDADAYATALMVMGPEEAIVFANSINLAAYFIISTDSGYESRYTKRFNQFIEP